MIYELASHISSVRPGLVYPVGISSRESLLEETG